MPLTDILSLATKLYDSLVLIFENKNDIFVFPILKLQDRNGKFLEFSKIETTNLSELFFKGF
jgi:hypothetical protein